MAAAKKTTKTAAKKTPAKKRATAAKKPAAPQAAAPPAPPAEPLPQLPAPPDGYTWTFNPSSGEFALTKLEPTAHGVGSEPGAKIIRNLRSVPVHMRLQGTADKQFRVELKPRGAGVGDSETIPYACTLDPSFIRSYEHGLFEIITRTEANAVNYPLNGFRQKEVRVIHTEDTVVAHKTFEQNEKGQLLDRSVEVQPVGPRVVNRPGSDRQLTAMLNESPAALQEMQNATGRKEVAPTKLVREGVMPALPERSVIEYTRG